MSAPISMRAYLTIRCYWCPNQSFRSTLAAEQHVLNAHGKRSGLLIEWVGLPDGVYAGGDKIADAE